MNGQWQWNTAPSNSAAFHAAWADNRDVQPPPPPYDWSKYTAPGAVAGQPSIFDPTKTLEQCVPTRAGMRDQNTYTSRLTQGLVVTVPGNSKPLGQFQRAYVVFAQNTTRPNYNNPLASVKYFRLSIEQPAPAGTIASFLQFRPQNSVDVAILARSSVARPVFVTSTNPDATVRVRVEEIAGIGAPSPVPGGLAATAVINPDILNPDILNPERFTASEGVPGQGIWAMVSDAKGRLWIGTENGGLARLDEPNVQKPIFQIYTTASGLSSSHIWSLVEDNAGYIYAATGRGLDRIDPSQPVGPGAVKRFAPSDGFLKGEVRSAYRDRSGTLWFASVQGVARLTPSPPVEPFATTVRITGMRVNGASQAPASNLNFGSDIRQLEVQFSGIDYTTNHQLLYQYKLEGTDPDWSAPTPERRVNYANLRPGRYRFMVRTAGSEPASLTFSIEGPLSQRWWFRLVLVIVLASAAYAAHRIRLSRLLAVERLRRQIATDLHDDIGSSLSQIAVLSEVARLHVDTRDESVAQPLARIGEVARELADSMSDIVWAINPKHDHLADLVYRMRRFADETLNGGNIRFDMAVEGSGTLALDASQRRDVFLIFKESVHNAVRHSGGNVVAVTVSTDHKRLSLRISDNGKGFALDRSENGSAGLESIRSRAARLNARLAITSENGQGTSVHILVSLGKRDYMNV